jgi:hypothetical protein
MQTQNAHMVKFTSNLYADGWKIFHKNAACIAMHRFKTVNCDSVHTLYQYLTDWDNETIHEDRSIEKHVGHRLVKYWYKVCTESQLTVLKRCMAMQAAFLWKIFLLFLPCGYSLFYHLWCFFPRFVGFSYFYDCPAIRV